MFRPRHLFFDLDRTLWDFEANSKKALQILFRDLGLKGKISHFNHFYHTYVRINAELWKQYGKGKIHKDELRDSRFMRTLEHHDIRDPQLASVLSDRYLAISPRQTLLFPGTLETLQDLKKQGYAMHIITNGFEEVQHIKLRESGLSPFFDVIICSETIGFTKPDKRVFAHALHHAGAHAAESVMIGDDREIDVLGAIAAGMRAIHFDPGGQSVQVSGEHRIRSLAELPLLLHML